MVLYHKSFQAKEFRVLSTIFHFALFRVGAAAELILLMSNLANFCYLTNKKRVTRGEFQEIKRLVVVLYHLI